MLHMVSVVIPVGGGDEFQAEKLKATIMQYSPDVEVIITTGVSRSQALNRALTKVTREYVWVLHADSFIQEQACFVLDRAIQSKPDALFYFYLHFYDGGFQMKLNAFGAKLRSVVLKTPFGDQGLCVKLSLLQAIGGFDESVMYGEDHVMVWQLRQKHIPLWCLGKGVSTSARKYIQNGWLQITGRHIKMWLVQYVRLKYSQWFRRE